MSFQFQIEITFSIIAKEGEEFFIQHQSHSTPKKNKLFPLNVSILTILLLTSIECVLDARCYTGIVLLFTITREVEVSVSFHHLWYRKDDSHTQHHAAKEWKKQEPISESKAHEFSNTSLCKTRRDTGHELNGTQFLPSPSVPLQTLPPPEFWGENLRTIF